MKVRTQQADITSIKPYLDHFSSMHLKAYFTSNDMVTPIHLFAKIIVHSGLDTTSVHNVKNIRKNTC